MQRKDLESLGLSADAIAKAELPDDLIDRIMSLHGKDIETHKNKLSTAEQERDNFKTQLSDANKQIDGFKGMKTPEDVEKAVGEWKVKFEEAERNHASQVSALQFDFAFSDALKNAGVRYPNEVKAKLSLDALKDKDGKFSADAFEKQIAGIKEKSADLFVEDKETVSLVSGGNGTNVLSDNFLASALRGAGISPEGNNQK